jgi:hypothetical protein
MNISIATIKDYDKNNKQSATNVMQNKAKQSQFQTGHLGRYYQTKPKVSDKLYRKAIK